MMPSSRPSSDLERLPPIWAHDPLPEIQSRLASHRHKVVVLDDDPTGTQTVRDIAVITRWDAPTLTAEFVAPASGFYILTNARSLPPPQARALNLAIAHNLRSAARALNTGLTVISRSDSTLRGHYPLETDALDEVLGPFDLTVIAPFFEAGGRITWDDVHYVRDGETLIPASQTPFARDASFGFRHSHLASWVEEKTAGRIQAADVASIGLDLLRRGGPAAVAQRLATLPRGTVCVVNAVEARDIEVFALGALETEQNGRKLLYRTAAAFAAARLGQRPGGCLTAEQFSPTGPSTGGLVVVGSYVPKTTEQVAQLRSAAPLQEVELEVDALLDPMRRDDCLSAAIRRTNEQLALGRDVMLFTSRNLVVGSDAATSLAIGARVSDGLVAVVQGLNVRPRFLVAKGGITSSDVATRGLNVVRAVVRGQLLPGVPVWRLGAESRYPGLDYVVFPGNVGGPTALSDALGRLRPPLGCP